jgi:hypothetical protein
MTDKGLSRLTSMIAEEQGVEFSADRLRLWAFGLRDVSDAQGLEAGMRLLQESPYRVRLADVRRVIFGAPDERQRSLEDEAELAVCHVEQHLCDHRLCDLGPTLNAAIRAMGGVDAVMALMGTEQWRFERTRLRTLYRALKQRGVSASEAEVLMPRAIAEHLATMPLSVYQERGLPLPIVCAPFGNAATAALPSRSA